MDNSSEGEIAYLLDYDGTHFVFDEGYWVKIAVRQTQSTPERPHGLVYSLTLHDPDGHRLLGFDNAHGVRSLGGRYARKPVANDHWHRTEVDEGRPYGFTSALKLVEDFLAEVDRTLAERGVSAAIRDSKGRDE